MSDLQSNTIPKTTVDVRTLAPMYRHQSIFETFESLLPGENFLLVNDHDPKPLYYQFQANVWISSRGIMWRRGQKCGASLLGKPSS